MLYLQSCSVPAFLAACHPHGNMVPAPSLENEANKIPETLSFYMCRKVVLIPFEKLSPFTKSVFSCVNVRLPFKKKKLIKKVKFRDVWKAQSIKHLP